MTENADGAKLPKIKYDRVEGSTKVEELNVTDKESGKKYPIKQENFTETEIEDTHLIKIAPLTYFCTDNNKVLWIPFSIKFSVLEFLQQTAKMSTNLQALIDQLQDDANKKTESEKGSK